MKILILKIFIHEGYIASGVTKDQLQRNIAEVVPEDKIDRVYIFKT